jgi:hypothetical protein
LPIWWFGVKQESAPLRLASAGKNMHMTLFCRLVVWCEAGKRATACCLRRQEYAYSTVLPIWWFGGKQESVPLLLASAGKNMHMTLFCQFGGLAGSRKVCHCLLPPLARICTWHCFAFSVV